MTGPRVFASCSPIHLIVFQNLKYLDWSLLQHSPICIHCFVLLVMIMTQHNFLCLKLSVAIGVSTPSQDDKHVSFAPHLVSTIHFGHRNTYKKQGHKINGAKMIVISGQVCCVVGNTPHQSQTQRSGFKTKMQMQKIRMPNWIMNTNDRITNTLAPALPRSGVQAIIIDCDISKNLQIYLRPEVTRTRKYIVCTRQIAWYKVGHQPKQSIKTCIKVTQTLILHIFTGFAEKANIVIVSRPTSSQRSQPM